MPRGALRWLVTFNFYFISLPFLICRLSRPFCDELLPDFIFLRLIQPSLQLFYKESIRCHSWKYCTVGYNNNNSKDLHERIWKQKTFVNWKMSPLKLLYIFFSLFFVLYCFIFTRLILSWLRLSCAAKKSLLSLFLINFSSWVTLQTQWGF
jgi:hypothetical protein